jgi:hypothetical protein
MEGAVKSNSFKVALAAGATLAALIPRPLGAMSIRDDRSDAVYYGLGNEARYAGVGAVNGVLFGSPFQVGSGTLISPKWVLTAGHVVDGQATFGLPLQLNIGGTKFDNGTGYSSPNGSFFPHPSWNRNNILAGNDMGLMKLSSAVSGVTPSSRFTGTDLLGRVGTSVGFGIYGTGTNPGTNQDGRKRAGSNIIDVYGVAAYGATDQLIASDFDDPNNADGKNPWGSPDPLNNECCVSSGDSGGGVFVDVGTRSYLAAVHSFVEDIYSNNTADDNSSYGDTYGSTRVSFFNSWVDDNITVKWASASGGAFSTGGNWTGGAVPDANDAVGLNTAGTFNITFGGNIGNDRVIARNGNVTLALANRTWTLSSLSYEGSLIVGRYGGNNAALTVSNGTLDTKDVVLAEQVGSTGTLTVASGGMLNVTGDVYAGGSFVAPGGNATIVLNGSSNTMVSGTVKLFGGGTLNLAGGAFSAGAGIDLAGGTVLNNSTATLATPIFASVGGTIGGASPLTLSGPFGSAANASLLKTGPSILTISGPQNYGANTTLTVAAGTLNLNSNAGGAGGGAPNLAVVANASTTFGSTQNLRALSIGAGATATLTSGGAKTIKTGSLTLAATAKLNLGDNDLIVDYTGNPSPIGAWTGATYTGITGLIRSGRNGGGWNGDGIVTTSANGSLTTLGVVEASQALGLAGTQTAMWSSQSVDADSVLVMYTYGGDANLDGQINIDDYGHIDTSVGIGLKGWFNGDFNFDGVINIDDYGIIDVNVDTQGPPLGGVAESFSLTAVPEPSISLLILSTFWTASRRRSGRAAKPQARAAGSRRG